MAGRQRIDRVRRQYNQWVANQTLEDYALRFTAKSARRWSAARVANTALGAISFLALEAIGGTHDLVARVSEGSGVVLEKPVVYTLAYRRMPNYKMVEFVCENNREYLDEKGAVKMKLRER